MTTPPGRKALFLDRDGVINVDRHYVHRVEDFEFLPGIFGLCTAAAERGYLIVVVTNQAGIGRGFYTEADFQRLTAWMVSAFRQRGIVIARVYHCPYHPTAGVGEYRRESFDRKPHPGMLLKARDELGLDLVNSVLIGDKDSDMAAGLAAGVGRLLKLAAGATSRASDDGPVLAVDSLEAVTVWLSAQSPKEQPPSGPESSAG